MTYYRFVAAALLLMRFMARRWRSGLGMNAAGIILFLPASSPFVLALMGKAPAMFKFVPYFTFGCAHYVSAARGHRLANLQSGLSLAGFFAQFA